MATASFDDRGASYGEVRDAHAADWGGPAERSVGEHIFIWLAWALAAAFWGVSMTTFVGILREASKPAAVVGGVDAGGMGFLLMDVIGGIVVLGLAIAFGAWRYATRDRSLDPVTEASTAALYDSIERQGGDDVTSRSPEARSPLDRDAARLARRDLG